MSTAIVAWRARLVKNDSSWSVNGPNLAERQTAIAPMALSRAIIGATMSRSSTSSSVPAMWTVRGSVRTSLTNSARRAAIAPPMTPSPSMIVSARISSATAPRAAMALKVPSDSRRNTAVVSPARRTVIRAIISSRTAPTSRVAEISAAMSASADISSARRRVSATRRPVSSETLRLAASVCSRLTSPGRNACSRSRFCTETTPVASPPTMSGAHSVDSGASPWRTAGWPSSAARSDARSLITSGSSDSITCLRMPR